MLLLENASYIWFCFVLGYFLGLHLKQINSSKLHIACFYLSYSGSDSLIKLQSCRIIKLEPVTWGYPVPGPGQIPCPRSRKGVPCPMSGVPHPTSEGYPIRSPGGTPSPQVWTDWCQNITFNRTTYADGNYTVCILVYHLGNTLFTLLGNGAGTGLANGTRTNGFYHPPSEGWGKVIVSVCSHFKGGGYLIQPWTGGGPRSQIFGGEGPRSQIFFLGGGSWSQ